MATSDESNGRRVRPPSERHARKGHGVPFYVLVFITAVLVLNAVFGDRGVLAMLRARQQYNEMVTDLARARAENDRLREEMRRLNEDPATIEDFARRELNLIKPGEKVFIIKDLPPAGTRK